MAIRKAARQDASVANVPEAEDLATPVKAVPNEEFFWESRDYLRNIRQRAWASRVSPVSLLAVVLARTLAEISPIVVLPALRGGTTSCNLFVALVGKSGSGKTASIGAAESARSWKHTTDGVGSGEGLLKVFGVARKDGSVWNTYMHNDRALVIEDEIDNIAALKDRSGSTLMPVLRKMWGGSSVKFSYSDPSKATRLEAHSYRLSLVVGVQPGRGAALFDDADAGTPQRFLWASVYDPSAPQSPPLMPPPMPWRVPPDPDHDEQSCMAAEGEEHIVIEVDDTVRAEIDEHQFRSLKGETSEIEDAKGHGMLTRLKVAAVLGLLDGRRSVMSIDWKLAEQVMIWSDAALQVVLDKLRTESDRRAKSKIAQTAEGIAVGSVRADARMRDRALQKGAEQVARHVHRAACGDDGCPRKCVTQSVAGRNRKYASTDEILAFAIDKGWIVEDLGANVSPPKGGRIRYLAGEAVP